MGARVFLGLFALVSLPYGIFCFIRPEFLDAFAGVTATSTTGTVELRAMYGGLQTAFGLLALLGALTPRLFSALGAFYLLHRVPRSVPG